VIWSSPGRESPSIGINNHLHVAQVGNGIQCVRDRPQIPPAMAKMNRINTRNLFRALAPMTVPETSRVAALVLRMVEWQRVP